MAKIEATINPQTKHRLSSIIADMGISEAEYVRGALLARMRRDTRRDIVRLTKIKD